MANAVTLLPAPAAAEAAGKSYRAEIRRTTGGRAPHYAAHYADQTRLYSRKQWLPMRFTERQTRGDPEYERTVATGRR